MVTNHVSPSADRSRSRYAGGRSVWLSVATVTACFLPTVAFALAETTPTAQPGLADAIPHDAVAVFFAQQPASINNAEKPWSPLKLATFVADRANQAGLLSRLDATSRQWIDVAGTASVLFDYPHAVALLDVRMKADGDDGHALGSLQVALIIQTRGDNDRVSARIQQLLGVYTNTEHAKLSEQTRNGTSWFSVRDARLADWAVISWGVYQDFYLVTIGQGAFERVVATLRDSTQSFAHDAWFTRAAYHADSIAATNAPLSRPRVRMPRTDKQSTQATSEANSVDASYAWFVRFERLRRSGNAGFDAKVQWIQFSLGLSGVEQGLWMAGQSPENGSVEIVGVHHRKGKDTVHLLAGEFAGDLLPPNAVPSSAGGFAVIDCNPPDVWAGASNAYLGVRSRDAQEDCSQAFEQIESDSGVSVERDIFPLLAGPVVIHNYPQHALRLPLAWTLQVPIRGESAVLRDRVDRILRAVQGTLADGDGILLQQAEDKVWHLQYGLAGPALAITERWVIVSFSPYAVRQNLAMNRRSVVSSEPSGTKPN